MLYGLEVPISNWAYASSAISIIFFIAVVCLFIRYVSYKRTLILYGAVISALANFISACLILAFSVNKTVRLNSLYFFRTIHYVFAFFLMLYTFRRIIVQNKGYGTLSVFIGYIWMAVTVGLSFTATVTMKNNAWANSDYQRFNIPTILLVENHAIWGFFILSVFLYFANRRCLNPNTSFSILAYIAFILVAAIVNTLIFYNQVPYQNQIAIFFFLVELPIKFAVLVAAYYGPTWVENISSAKGLETRIRSNR